MADVVAGNASWLQAAEEELRQLLDDMLHTEKTHMAAAERLRKLNWWLGLAATVLATGATATIFAADIPVVAGILALAAAIVSAVITFMKPERTAEQHLAVGRQLAALRVHARQTLNLDLASMNVNTARKAIDDIAKKKAAIDEGSPGTGKNDYAIAREKIVKGTFDRDR